MKLIHILTLVAILSAAEVSLAQNASDEETGTGRTLEEVVVRSERAWVEGNKAVFIPTRSEKNLSDDPASLVRMMHIPLLDASDGTIRNLAGKEVPVFINGRRADEMDIATFWPKHARRVEYIEYPTEGGYEGLSAVINFVMPEYTVGGVTRAGGLQMIPGRGSYDVASKLSYRRMTYGVMAGTEYWRDHSRNNYGEERFDDIFYGGEPYGKITRRLEEHTWERENTTDLSLNARYEKGSFRVTHTLSARWNRNPGTGGRSSDLWEPDIFDSHASSTHSDGRSFSPQVRGDYSYAPAPKWYLTGRWNFSTASNDNFSLYQADGLEGISNSVHERVNTLGAYVNATFNCSRAIYAGLSASSSFSRFSDRYAGSVNERLEQRLSDTRLSLNLVLTPLSTFQIGLYPGAAMAYRDSGDGKGRYEWLPTLSGGVVWAPSRRFWIQLSQNYGLTSPGAAPSSDIIRKVSELEWISGNPGLKNASDWRSDLTFFVLLPKDIRFTVYSSYDRELNSFVTTYDTAPRDMGGIVRTYSNAPLFETFAVDGKLSWSGIGNRLSINLQPTWRYYRSRGAYASSMGWFRMRGSADFRMGDFLLAVYYNGTQKYMYDAGMERSWRCDDYGLQAVYGNGNIRVQVTLDNIFRNRDRGWKRTVASHYAYLRDWTAQGRTVKISLSYTFDYGKKVDRSIDISGPENTATSILGAGEKD